MNRTTTLLTATCALLSSVAAPGISRAQHIDVLVEQQNGRLVTGSANFDTNSRTAGRRVFSYEFDGDFAVNNPGYNSLAAGSPSLPAGTQALPGNTALAWAFLPMTIAPHAANLFYWNGLESDGSPGIMPSDVQFGALPGPSYTLSLFDQSGVGIAVDGSNNFVPGGAIGSTTADGSLHLHRYYFLQDNDGNGATLPADGIYLFAMQFRMPGLQNSLPIFMVFGTPGSSVAALDTAAVPWVEQQLNLPGDFNQNGAVDAADYIVWRNTFNQTGAGLPADGDNSGTVDQLDYNLWRANVGGQSQLTVTATGTGATAGSPSSAIPEPGVGQLLLAAALTLALLSKSRATL